MNSIPVKTSATMIIPSTSLSMSDGDIIEYRAIPVIIERISDIPTRIATTILRIAN